MKILAVAVMSLTFSCLLPVSQGQVERYKMSIVEKGTTFTEKIEIDESQDVEVFRVPAHNDVIGADYYHDFKMRVTVTKVLSRKSCYIAKMDPSMPSPKKLKADLARVASQPGELPIRTQERLVLVTGTANRLELTKEILDFCGALPIYKTKVYNNTMKDDDGTLTIKTTGRQRRQTIKMRTCLLMETGYGTDPLKYVKAGGCSGNYRNWHIICKFARNYYPHIVSECHYYFNKKWVCLTRHYVSGSFYCCDYKCP